MAEVNEMKNLGLELVTAWAELPAGIANDAHNPHFGNNYASLETCLKAIKPVFKRHGLALVQCPGPVVVLGDIAYASLTTAITHVSGERLVFTSQAPIQPQWDKKAGYNRVTAQGYGSAVAYLRRYALLSIAGFAQTDDDGEAANGDPAPVNERPPADSKAKEEKPAETKRGPGRPPKAKAEGESYAVTRAKLEERIGLAKTSEELEKTKAEVIDLGDDEVGKVYVAKLRELKGKK